jgi:hypothetical protein
VVLSVQSGPRYRFGRRTRGHLRVCSDGRWSRPGRTHPRRDGPPAKVAGEPLRTSWDPLTGVFELDFVPVASTRAKESEIFIPNMLLHGQPLDVRGLSEKARDRWVHQEQVQTLFVVHGDAEVDRVVRLSVHFGRPISPPFKLSLFRENLMTIVQAVFLLMLSVSVLVVVAK